VQRWEAERERERERERTVHDDVCETFSLVCQNFFESSTYQCVDVSIALPLRDYFRYVISLGERFSKKNHYESCKIFVRAFTIVYKSVQIVVIDYLRFSLRERVKRSLRAIARSESELDA
jgi:hypothetical protein